MSKISFSNALKGLEAKAIASVQLKDETATASKNSDTLALAQKLLRNKEVSALLQECNVGAVDLSKTMYVSTCVVFLAHELTQETATAKNVRNDNFILGLKIVANFSKAQDRGEKVTLTKNVFAHAISGHKLQDESQKHLIVTRSIIGETQLNYTLNFLQRIKVIAKVGESFTIANNAILSRAIEKFAL